MILTALQVHGHRRGMPIARERVRDYTSLRFGP